jgi:hypothetical protein
MASCSNCKKNLSCGCQKRTAKDGASVCSNCITSYETKLAAQNPIRARQVNPPKSNTVWGKNRYTQT